MEPTKELGMEEFTHGFALPGQIQRCEVLGRSWGHREGRWVGRDSLGQTAIVKCQFEGDKMVNFSSGFCYHQGVSDIVNSYSVFSLTFQYYRLLISPLPLTAAASISLFPFSSVFSSDIRSVLSLCTFISSHDIS